MKGDDAPIVVCAFDFLGIANEAHDAWRVAIAAAAGTMEKFARPDLRIVWQDYLFRKRAFYLKLNGIEPT